MAARLPEGGGRTSAAAEVADLLRRLGHGSTGRRPAGAGPDAAPVDQAPDQRDDRTQEQRSG